MKIGIDVDGVLRDFCQGFESVLKKHYPHYLPKDYTGINNWKCIWVKKCGYEAYETHNGTLHWLKKR